MREPLRNYTDAAAWLGVPRRWLEDEVRFGRVSHTRIGKHVRFTQEHLDELVARGEQRADQDLVPPPRDMSLKPAARRRKPQ